MQGYDEDLAYIHDAGFSWFAQRAAPGALALLRRFGIRGGMVIDMGCGSGVWAERLVAEGYDVLGIDISGPMIAMARRRVPSARFLRASFLQARLPPCDAVTSIGECINYLLDARSGRRGLAALFARVRDALNPGGLLVLDFAEPGRGGSRRSSYHLGDDWAILVEAEEDRRHSLLVRRLTTFRRIGRLYRRSEQTHRLRLYRKAEIASILRRSGFAVRHLSGYGGFHLPRGHAVIMARRLP